MVDLMRACSSLSLGTPSRKTIVGKAMPVFQEIDPTMLQNPVQKAAEHYVGRGSFGIVKVKVFRGILVAVKEFLPRSLKTDVHS